MQALTACGAILVAVIVAATAMLAINMRASALKDTERELQNISLILSEQTAQSFHALELVQASIVDSMRVKEIETATDLEHLMSGQDVHRTLVDKISGLPHVDAITIINEHGKLINFSRSWPIPAVNVADRDYFKALRADPRLVSFLSEPVRNRATGTWTIYLARKFTGSDGKFLGLILGAIRLQYFQSYFGSISLGAKEGSISLFRGDGMLLARYPNQPETVGRIFPTVAESIVDGDGVIMRLVSPIDREERLIAARPIRGFPGYVTVSTTAGAATIKAERDAMFLAGAGGALALSIGTLVFLIARRSATEHARTQHALQNQQQQLDAAINNMSQGLLMFDRDGRIVLCNDRYIQMYSLSREIVAPGRSVLELIEARKAAGTFSGDPREYCAEVWAAVARGGSAATTDTPDGRTIYVINRPIAGGGWVATHEDITDRRRAEKERDRNRDFLDQVIESVPVMIIVKDARDLSYVLLNKASETRLGVTDGSGLGKTAQDIFSKETADRIEAADRSVLQNRQTLVLDEHVIDLPVSGQRIQKTTRVPIFGNDGEPQYVLIVAEDLTDRRTIERQLQQAMKMEAVGNLTGGIAHDFNNLLMVMIGNLDLLAEDIGDNPAAREKVEAVLEASLHGAELTRQMLAFARRQPLNPKRVDVKELIGATTKLLSRSLGTDVAIELRIVDGLWPVRVDESQLQSSIINVSINARDAMPGGGTLIIEAENVTLDRDAANQREQMNPGDYVAISVSDTGTGMSPELMARVFEPFVTTKSHGKGTGLGLSMVYGFAKQSGGHVSIYSEVGRGTTLKLYLPRTIEEGCPQTEPSADLPALGGGEVILAVDDNKGVLATVTRQLSDLGYAVITAGSAFSALRMLESGVAADLLFTDVVMPGGLSGKDLADEAQRKYPHLKVLLTSGFTDAFLANDAVLNNKYTLLTKPYRKRDLACAVRRVLDQNVTSCADAMA